MSAQPVDTQLTFSDFKEEILNDLRIAWQSRHTSIFGRKEVLRGKAKFGIMGAGKELPQIALSKFFQNGDFRAGYYRDQTIALATEAATVQQMFSLLYSDADLQNEPHSGGRQMSSHFATRLLDENGEWKDHLAQKNHSADSAPTASQMGRAIGLAFASKLYRQNNGLAAEMTNFTDNGNEVVFATIGDASTSEGIFWEAVNAAGVLQVPMVLSVWDDGYGISVPKEFQTTKSSISEALSGFQKEDGSNGFQIFTVKAWDYPGLISTYEKAVSIAREQHTPVLVHVLEVTQPQGHSTSGSHERYKNEERLAWEQEFDCIKKLEEWIAANGIADLETIEQIQQEAKSHVKAEMDKAWQLCIDPGKALVAEINTRLDAYKEDEHVAVFLQEVNQVKEAKRSVVDRLLREFRIKLRRNNNDTLKAYINEMLTEFRSTNLNLYQDKLFSESPKATVNVKEVAPEYADDAKMVNGFELLNACFDANLSNYPEMIAFGEDLGKIGGVNQGFAGLQDKYGEQRVFDVGIREGTIMGQAIGTAMRGFRPIAEIQYVDYLLYGLQQLSDEAATLSYRTKGGQKAPLIIRTRGHRLEGIWHTGSPLGLMVNSLRGMHVLVPRNMTQAAGFYNTLLQGDEPAILVEVLNGYRLKEKLPANIGEFTVPIGKVELMRSGTDITLVTYGACVRIAQDAADELSNLGISVEIIDAQSLLPFDINHDIVESVKKTNRLVVLDEDVPGGASAFMLQNILEEQGAYQYLDSKPMTITAKAHRAGYGSEYNHFTKPQPVDVIEKLYEMMHEVNPAAFPKL